MSAVVSSTRLGAKPLSLLAACACLVLAGCSGRDTDISEKLAAADAAAARAEAAATRAEAAAKSARNAGQTSGDVVEEAEPGIEDPTPPEDPHQVNQPAPAPAPPPAAG